MPKRGEAPSKVQEVAKKAKTEQPEAPVLAALAAAGLPKPCQDLLQAALLHCLATPCGDRHKFQLEVLDRITSIFGGIEKQKRAALSEVEAQLASAHAEQDTASSDSQLKKANASAKKSESDEKGKLVDEAAKAVHVAEDAAKVAQQQSEDCCAKKQKLLGEQEEFQKVIDELYQPLKAGAIPSKDWRKRNKTITELLQKLNAASTIEDSLSDALEVALKTRPDLREPFSNATVEFAEKALEQHKDKFTQDALVLDEEAATHQAAIAAAATAVTEKKSETAQAEQEWEAKQNEWVELEDASNEALRALRVIDMEVGEVHKKVQTVREGLEKFLAVQTLFSDLKEPGRAAQLAEPMEAVHEEEPLEPLEKAAEERPEAVISEAAAEPPEAVLSEAAAEPPEAVFSEMSTPVPVVLCPA